MPATTRSRPKRDRAASWTCVGCAVTVSYAADATPPAQPEGWVRSEGNWICLRCRREQAMDRAAAAAGTERWASRRQALVEFELQRDPGESDVVIAKRANCSTNHVRKLRASLRAAGKLKRGSRRRS